MYHRITEAGTDFGRLQSQLPAQSGVKTQFFSEGLLYDFPGQPKWVAPACSSQDFLPLWIWHLPFSGTPSFPQPFSSDKATSKCHQQDLAAPLHIFYSNISICVCRTECIIHSCWSPEYPAGNSTEDWPSRSSQPSPPSLRPPGRLLPLRIWNSCSPTCHSSFV